MSSCQKLLAKARNSRTSLRFSELCTLVECYGFELDRIRGDHHIYKNRQYRELINLQPGRNGDAKPYQVRQVLNIIDDLYED